MKQHFFSLRHALLGLTFALTLSPLCLAQDICLSRTKTYVQPEFDPDDFLATDQGILVGADLTLDTEELDLESLVLGLEQPFYVDFLSEGAGASHTFGFFFLDIDTDKDGFPDFFETDDYADLDGDGFLNIVDEDDDGDGIKDVDDVKPTGVTSMPASVYRNGDVAANASISGKSGTPDYWQFVPNSKIAEGTYKDYYEMPGTYLYIDNNSNSIPDVLEYTTTNYMAPYVVDKGYAARHKILGSFLGLLGNDWTYQGTPGSTTADKYHWSGSTIFYICDDDGDVSQHANYTSYLPYKTGSTLKYKDDFSTTDANIDYLIYGSSDPKSPNIPSTLVDTDSGGNKTFKTDGRGQQQYKYRWYKSTISGARELVFWLAVFYPSTNNVNTYYSKSRFNPDNPPTDPNRNAATNGDQFGKLSATVTGTPASNWYPNRASTTEHNTLVTAIFGGTVTKWTDIASIPGAGASPVLNTGAALKDSRATQEWVDEWENFTTNRRILQYRALADWFSETPLSANTIINGRYSIDMSAEGDSSIIRAFNNKMVHLMVGAPQSTKDAWLLGWEDLYAGGDRDYEDVVFYVKRAAGGELVSLNVADEIGQGASEDAEFSISQVNFTFEDNFVDSKWGTSGRYIAYFYRLSQNDEWTVLLGDNPPDNQHHTREVDKFQPAFGGTTTLLPDGVTVRRSVSIPVEDKKTELYWKVQMASENVDSAFQPKVTAAEAGYQSLVHDFYYNSAVIPNSDITYIASHETPSYSWDEQSNRGHLYAFQSFIHGDPITLTVIDDESSPEKTPTSQPVAMFQKDADSDAINLFKWDAGVTMLTDLKEGNDRTIYTYIANNTETLETNLGSSRVLLDPNASDLSTELIEAFDFSSDKTSANVWVDNYQNPSAEERDPEAAAIWLINWIHGQENPVVSEDGVVSSAEIREWVLGGINRASPLVIRAPGRPTWLDRSSEISVIDKRSFIQFAEEQAELPTRLLIGTESGLIHCIDAGEWVGKPKKDPETGAEYPWAEGHYNEDNYGTGREVWAFLPGHLVPDIKYNYTHAKDIVAKCDATAVATIVKDDDTWKRVVVFAQGYKAGSQTIDNDDRIGNVIWAMDLTDVDNPIPLWHRSDANTQDIINPISMGWMKVGTDPIWVAVYPSGGTPVADQVAYFNIVNALTGALIQSVAVGSEVNKGNETMLGTPALIDTDGDGYIDHVFGATSEGWLFAYNTVDSSLNTKELSGSFYLAPNIDLDGDGNVRVVALTGDSPLVYDSPAKPFNNQIYYYTFVVEDNTWDENGTITMKENHKAFSRPKLIGQQLVVGTTTGDTFNFCDADPDDPGDLVLYDLTEIGTDDVLDDIISGYGSVLAPIVVSDGRVLAHGSTSEAEDPRDEGSVFSNRQTPRPSANEEITIADIFGVFSWQDELIQALKNAQSTDAEAE